MSSSNCANGENVKSISYAKRLTTYCLDILLPRRKAMAELRAQWGRRGNKRGLSADRWFKISRGQTASVDDRTWVDLEFPRIFADLDTTVTPLGSQVLYRKMREYVDDHHELAARHALHVRLRDDKNLREYLQQALLPLRDAANAYVVDVLFADAPEQLIRLQRFSIWTGFSIAWLVVVMVSPLSIWWWLALLPINFFILYRYSLHIQREIEALNGCMRMLQVANGLCDEAGELTQQRLLFKERGAHREARRALSLVYVSRLGQGWLMPMLNGAFLLDLIINASALGKFYSLRHRLHSTFELIGGIDAAIAIASALVMHPVHCHPQLATNLDLDIQEGRHPLLPVGVLNSISLNGRSALITGSNMAGKTTFIKMVAINAILGRTVGFCTAARACLPSIRVMSAIYSEHSVESGKSHYFTEIEVIRGFLDEEARGGGCLLILDEPFSGTNTPERIAIASAVLGALSGHSLVLVTTHDVELQSTLGHRYELYHFQENPEVEGFFDYRLRSGPATERNAIRLIERMGFPTAIVKDAMGFVKE